MGACPFGFTGAIRYPLSVVDCEVSIVDDDVVPVPGVADIAVALDVVDAAALGVGFSAERIRSAAACVRSAIAACV